MCGITGAMSCVLNEPEKAAFRDLFNVASLRGRDGSGVVIVGENPKKRYGDQITSVLKSRLISGWLAYSQDLDQLLCRSTTIALGHARWPTKGGTDTKAIHPHRSGHIIGVHNGTMFEVCGKKVDNESDSALIFKGIAEKGIEEVWKTSSGPAALVWIDEKRHTINFIRNAGRPLFFRNYGWSRNISTMYWSSEAGMLDFILPRHFAGTNHWSTYLPENVHFAYPMDPEAVIRPVTSVKIEKPTPAYTGSVAWADYPGGDDLPFLKGDGGFHKDTAPRFLTEEHKNPLQMTVGERAEAARLRLAERVAAAKRIKDALDAKTPKTTTQDGVASRHTPSAPPFHMRGRHEHSLLPESSVINLPAVRDGGPAWPPSIQRTLDELNDDISDVGKDIFAGHKCCWCGDKAGVGDKVFPIYNTDMGSKEFLCVDCVRNPDTQCFLSKDQDSSVVTN